MCFNSLKIYIYKVQEKKITLGPGVPNKPFSPFTPTSPVINIDHNKYLYSYSKRI